MLKTCLRTSRGNSSVWDFVLTKDSLTACFSVTKRSFSVGSFLMDPDGVRVFRSGSRVRPQSPWQPDRRVNPAMMPLLIPKAFLNRECLYWPRPERQVSSRTSSPATLGMWKLPQSETSGVTVVSMSPTSCSYRRRMRQEGPQCEVELPHYEGGKQVSVHIPPGVRPGTKLRLRQMGRPLPDRPSSRGDLYLQLKMA